MRKSPFDKSLTKLVQARVLVGKKEAVVFDVLCGFQFREGLRVDSLRRVGNVIEFDPDYVRLSSLETLTERLAVIGRRANS